MLPGCRFRIARRRRSSALAPGVVMIDSGAGTAENYPYSAWPEGGRATRSSPLTAATPNAVGLTRPQQLTSLPVDAMQEFRVITNNYSAGVRPLDRRRGLLCRRAQVRTIITAASSSRCRTSVFERAQLLRGDTAADPL